MPWTRQLTRGIRNTALESLKKTGVATATKIATEYAVKNLGRVGMNYLGGKYSGNTTQAKQKKRRDKRVFRTNTTTEVSTNKNTIVLNKKQPKGKTAGKWKFVQISQCITRSVVGVQGVTKVFEVASKLAGLGTGTDPNTSGAPWISLINLADMNPYRKITGSALHTAGATPALDKYMIKTIDVELEILNAENTACVFDLYYVTRRQTGAVSFDVSWAQALANDAPAGQSATAYAAPGAVVPSSGQSGGYSKVDFAGENPFASRLMRKNWRLLKKTTVNMAVGVNEIIKTRILYNKVIDMQSLLLIDDANNIGNTTIECWVIQRGVTCIDATTAPAPRVTYGHSTIGFVQRIQYNMCAVYSNAARIDVTYVGANIPTNTPRNVMLHMNEDTEVSTAQIAMV